MNRLRVVQRQGRSAILLGQFFTIFTQDQWGVQVKRVRQAKRFLQQPLARCVISQVLASHHMRDVLCGVVHHHGELIGPKPISALQYKVAHFLQHILTLLAQPAVMPLNLTVLTHLAYIQSPCPRRFAFQPMAASARIHRCLMAHTQCAFFDLFASACTGVGQTLGHQTV